MVRTFSWSSGNSEEAPVKTNGPQPKEIYENSDKYTAEEWEKLPDKIVSAMRKSAKRDAHRQHRATVGLLRPVRAAAASAENPHIATLLDFQDHMGGYASWRRQDGWLKFVEPRSNEKRDLETLFGVSTGRREVQEPEEDPWLVAHFPGRKKPVFESSRLVVTGLNMSGNFVKCPPEPPTAILDRLHSLVVLELADAGFGGSVEDLVPFGCRLLERLNLHGNQLTGRIPGRLAELHKLVELRLSRNKLTGEIPGAVFAKLKNLLRLDLSSNRLKGAPIPADLEGSGLQHLKLGNNRFDRPLSITRSFDLRRLELHTNAIPGEIPSNIELLAQLRHFDVCGNDLRGSVPVDSLSKLRFLTSLILTRNNFAQAATAGAILQSRLPDALIVVDQDDRPDCTDDPYCLEDGGFEESEDDDSKYLRCCISVDDGSSFATPLSALLLDPGEERTIVSRPRSAS